MKRILYVFDIMNRGGAETFTMNVFRNIDKNKFMFDFLCLNKNEGAYDDEIRKLGGKIIYVDGNANNKVFRIHQIIKTLRKYNYDTIHITVGFYSGIICYCSKRAGIKKIIVHSHSAGDENANNFFRKIYHYIMRKFIIVFSNYKLSCGYSAGLFLFGKDTKFNIIYNSIDLDVFKNNPSYSSEIKKKYKLNNCIVIGEIARFSKVKNHMFFVNLAKYIKKQKINIKIMLVGDGPLKKYIMDEVNNNDLNDIFVFTGNTNEVYKYLNAIDVLVMPSLFEGFPMTVVESLACSTPCLLSDNISKEAAIIDDMILFLKLEDSEKKWIDNIYKLYNKKKKNFDTHSILLKKGFNIKSSVEALEKIYSE